VREIAPTETLLRRIEWVSGISLFLVTLAAGYGFRSRLPRAFCLAAQLPSQSFQVLKWQLRRAFQRPGKLPGKAGLFAFYYVRYLVVLFVVFVVLYYGWADPIPFLVGLSVMVLSITLVGGFEFISMAVKKGES